MLLINYKSVYNYI